MSAIAIRPSLPALPRIPGARVILACLLLALPGASGIATWRFLDWANGYYGGGDMRWLSESMGFRNQAGALIERASFLQASATGPVGYGWDTVNGLEPRRYLRAGPAAMSLEPLRSSPPGGGRDMAFGVVENGLGVVVVALSAKPGRWCEGVHYWMSPFTKSRARAAWLPGRDRLDIPDAKDVAAAAWAPAGEVMGRCAGDGPFGSLLLRFDPPAGAGR